MKKFIVFLIAFCMVFALQQAIAEKQLNPYFHEAVVPADVRAGIMPASDMTVSITASAEPAIAQTGEWLLEVSGGTAPYTYQYYILDENWDTHGYFAWSESAVCTYDFVVPGNYILLAYAKDSAGMTATQIATFEVTGGVTVAEKVKELVAECKAAGNDDDYETALWLHNWLINNAYYDETYSYYSADGVLLRGTGVCDSYSKAYALLLKEAGISAGRVIGGDHSWNIVNMDGEWYQIDPTWDDPIGGAQVAVSGVENRYYFGLTDEIMSIDHSYTVTEPCVAYANNYYVRSGKISQWTETFAVQIDKLLNEGSYAFSIELDNWYPIENSGYAVQVPHIVCLLSGYVLENETWMSNAEQVALDIAYNSAKNTMDVTAIPVESVESESNDFITEADSIEINGYWLNGTISTTSDRDYFAVSFPVAKNLKIEIDQKTTPKLLVEVYDVNGTLLYSKQNETNGSALWVLSQGYDWLSLEQYLLRLGGTYYLKISGSQGDYAVCCSEDTSVRPQSLKPSTLSAYTGDTIEFELSSTGNGTYTSVEYTILDINGQTVAGKTTNESTYAFVPEKAGTYTCTATVITDSGLAWEIHSESFLVKKGFAVGEEYHSMTLEDAETYQCKFELTEASILDFSVRVYQGFLQFTLASEDLSYMNLDGIQNSTSDEYEEINHLIYVPAGTYTLQMYAYVDASNAFENHTFDVQMKQIDAGNTDDDMPDSKRTEASLITLADGELRMMKDSSTSANEVYCFTMDAPDIVRIGLKDYTGETTVRIYDSDWASLGYHTSALEGATDGYIGTLTGGTLAEAAETTLYYYLTPGTYVLVVGGNRGLYDLEVAAMNAGIQEVEKYAMPDMPDNHSLSALDLPVSNEYFRGMIRTDYLSTGGMLMVYPDRDWYKIQIPAGQEVRFDFNIYSQGISVWLFGEDESVLGTWSPQNDEGSFENPFVWSPSDTDSWETCKEKMEQGGTFFVVLHTNDQIYESVYDLRCSNIQEKIIALDSLIPAAQSIMLGEEISVTALMTGSGEIEAMEYHVYDANGQYITGHTGVSTTYRFVPTSAGVYTIRVYMKPVGGEWSGVDSVPVTVEDEQSGFAPIRLIEFATDTEELNMGELINFVLLYEGDDIDAVKKMLFYTYDGQGNQLGEPWVYDGFISHYGFISSKSGNYAIRVFMLTEDGGQQVVTSPFFRVIDPNVPEDQFVTLTEFTTDVEELKVGEQINFLLNYTGSDTSNVGRMLFYTYDGRGNQLGDPWVYDGFISHYGFISSASGYYAIRVFMLTEDGGQQVVTSPFFNVVDPSAPGNQFVSLTGFTTEVEELKVGEQIDFLLTYTGSDTSNVGRMLFYTYDGEGNQLGDPWIYDGFIGHYGFISSIPGYYAIRTFMLTTDGGEQVVTSPFFQVYADINSNAVPATQEPTVEPMTEPNTEPTVKPTVEPTAEPTVDPTTEPTVEPTVDPTTEPTVEPTVEPTTEPTAEPTVDPTTEPTVEPTVEPTTEPTAELPVEPTTEPTAEPTVESTTEPTAEPIVEPTTELTAEPIVEPTTEPTAEPTVESTTEPTAEPTVDPTTEPTAELTVEPTTEPTAEPIVEPTIEPTAEPTVDPTTEPAGEPTVESAAEPINP